MKIGVHVSSYTWPGGPQRLAQDLTRIAQAAEHYGFDKLSVMDHLWQITHNGPPEHEMLEAYTTLGYLAARTARIQLLALVTAAIYREPGLLAKAVTTLDVLSEGRAWLGIGAGSSEQEARGLGLPFPPAGQRFERLEEALQICLQMWSDTDGPYAGRHYRLARTLNSPQPLTRPHPPILIGGGGEKQTLRLVAQHLILICQQGFQSSLAAATLQRLGLAQATDLDGGFDAWTAAGLPVHPAAPSNRRSSSSQQ